MFSPIYATRANVENTVISALAQVTTMLPSASASLGSCERSTAAQYMAKPPSKKDVEDEPGAEERFLSGVRKALETPPKPFTPPTNKAKKGKERKT